MLRDPSKKTLISLEKKTLFFQITRKNPSGFCSVSLWFLYQFGGGEGFQSPVVWKLMRADARGGHGCMVPNPRRMGNSCGWTRGAGMGAGFRGPVVWETHEEGRAGRAWVHGSEAPSYGKLMGADARGGHKCTVPKPHRVGNFCGRTRGAGMGAWFRSPVVWETHAGGRAGRAWVHDSEAPSCGKRMREDARGGHGCTVPKPRRMGKSWGRTRGAAITIIDVSLCPLSLFLAP